MPGFCTVRQKITAYEIDGADYNLDPDEVLITGKVIFTPLMSSGDSVIIDEEGSLKTTVLFPIEAVIMNGEIHHNGSYSIKLFAGGPDCNPSTIKYRASYRGLTANGVSVQLREIVFEAIPGEIINLTDVQPVAGTPGVGSIIGPQGERGLQGIQGERGLQGIQGERGPQGDPGEVTLAQLNQAIRVDTTVGTRVFAGDQMIYGDTGRRVLASWDAEGNITGNMPTGLIPSPNTTGYVVIRRENNLVTMYIRGGEATGGTVVVDKLGFGYSPVSNTWELAFCRIGTNTVAKNAMTRLGAGHVTFTGLSAGDKFGDHQYHVVMRYAPVDDWPTSLPGLPA